MKNILWLFLLVLIFAGSCSKKENETGSTLPYAGKELVVSTWGYNEDLLREKIFTPFENMTGASIILDTGGTADRFTKLSNNPQGGIDVFYTAESYSQKGVQEGLFSTIDKTKLTNISNLYSEAQNPNGKNYGIAYAVNRMGIVFIPENLPAGIELNSWKDLWNPALKNSITIPHLATTFGPAMIYIASQYADVNPQDDGGSAGLEAIKTLKSNIRKTYKRSSEAKAMLESGEILVALVADFAFGDIQKIFPNAVFKNPEEGSFLNFNTINITEGSKEKELGLKLIDFAISTEIQEESSKVKLDSPTNQNVNLTDEEKKGLTILSDLETYQTVNHNFVNANLSGWISQWNTIFTD